jgi:hypothetical protein
MRDNNSLKLTKTKVDIKVDILEQIAVADSETQIRSKVERGVCKINLKNVKHGIVKTPGFGTVKTKK